MIGHWYNDGDFLSIAPSEIAGRIDVDLMHGACNALLSPSQAREVARTLELVADEVEARTATVPAQWRASRPGRTDDRLR
jgi:hypothetical protein